MHKCIICGNDITYFQSYHIDATGSKHFSCEVGRSPLQHPISYYHGGEKARMTLGDEGVSPKKSKDIEPPLGGGGKGNHRTKRKHTAKHEGRAYHKQKTLLLEDSNDV